MWRITTGTTSEGVARQAVYPRLSLIPLPDQIRWSDTALRERDPAELPLVVPSRQVHEQGIESSLLHDVPASKSMPLQ